ncbi:MAG: LysR family transcriptional regulator [Noviherbaspirillum sp.]
MFELSQIRCFVAVAEELHFNRAAERLNMTQSPLSRQIRLLEHHVGTQLLDRTSRSVRLTTAGKAFFPEAARILRMAEEAASTARRVAKGEKGSLAIGFTAAFGYALVPRFVRRLRDLSPGISLTLKELVTDAQLEGLSAGLLDIGLMRPHPEHGDLRTEVLGSEALMLALPESEVGQWPQEPALASLHEKPFLMYSPYEARYFYQLLHDCFNRAGIMPDIVEYIGQIHTMMALVSSGIGIALIPQAAARIQFEGIVLRKVKSEPAHPVRMVYAYRKDNDNPILDIFRREILDPFRMP